MTHQQELDEARAEYDFRTAQLFALMEQRNIATWPEPQRAIMDAARDRYLALLAEDRIRKLAEVQS